MVADRRCATGVVPARGQPPYDADGDPLVGVQLFDQDGNRVDASRSDWSDGERVTVAYPWLNGGQRLFNVFPPPVRQQDAFSVGTRPQPDRQADEPRK